MVDTPKKRRAEKSSNSGATAPKRTRIHSTSSSTCSGSDTPLSKDEDWTFRIKVLSTTTSLNDELFRDAVKGLVRICFPDDILKQMRQHAVEQHMREKRAEPANIQRTIEAFQPEMIRRLIGMLAGYFDTPDQVASAVQAALGERHKTPNDEGTLGSSNTIVEESRPLKNKRTNHSRGLQEATPSRSYDNNLNGALVDVERQTTPAENSFSNSNTISQRQKDRKISATWNWNIDPNEVTEEAVQHAFPRTADLLDKLHKGNRGMLVRPELTLMNNGQFSRVTPAPSQSTLDIRNNGIPSHRNTIIKFEDTEDSVGEPNIQEAPITKATTQAIVVTRRRLLTEDRDLGSAVPGIEADAETRTSRSQSNDNIDRSFGMPVLQLLWGTDSLTPEMCVNDYLQITETIMNNLQRRIAAEAIASGLGGQSKTRTKDELRSSIVQAFPKSGQFVNFMRIKKDIEGSLVEWVIAEPQAFPELKAMPFVFARVLPHTRVVIESLFGSWSAVSTLSGVQVWGSILEALKQRGLSEASVGAANIDCLQIDSLCNNCKFPEVTRRALLERIFRRVVFLHKDKFPELKTTPVVKVWERKTGLEW
ncbi:hypothetical protein COCCADRAFT_37263 [Bipolaris zeicola 26-R-13]|uniref:Uncharacterized protein n=1 Tax=Cochliobolus carbonum (strain 26-R-13) TaxID=930089 RepID=W6XZC6_COCC2|nr:uncharacterized protein COCCADRAFT_37263 [Bipolaris zeicola 26-R-13]EUC32827.1 hypothetical protein COCCADRAFT_37263 [Bipolaris zeicola 26-R-13]